MSQNFIPNDQFIPDEQAQQKIPVGVPNFIPDSQFTSDEDALQEKHGTALEQTKAGLEGLARGVSLGTSDYLETRLGISSPEAIRARQEANPVTSTAGNMLGAASLIVGTGGVAAPVEAGLAGLGSTAARIAGYGIEGAVLGAGNTVSDASLGDVNINAQKILADIGMGAAFGAGLGALSKGFEAAGSLRKAADSMEPAEAIIEGGHIPIGEQLPIHDAPASYGVTPSSLEDLQARVKDATYRGESIELPQKEALESALNNVEMANPVHPLQFDSLKSQASRDLYKTAIEMPGKEGDAIRNYEALQKKELTNLTDKTIDTIAPEHTVTTDSVEGGRRAIDAFTEQYQAEKEALKPVFEHLKKVETENPFEHLPNVIEKLTDTLPSVAKMFDEAATEVGAIKPYKTNMGIDRATYNAVKEAVESLKEPAFLEDLMNIRKGMSQHVDVLAQGEAPAQIRALKASMMDYIQTQAEAMGESAQIRDPLRRYAINEQQRGVIEKAFGASVGSQEFDAISKVKPEKILDNIFRDTASAAAAKNILGPQKFNQMLADYLAGEKAHVTTDGVFSSNKFGSFLKKKAAVLNEAMKENPAALQEMRDINTISRILPDSKSINPSGTAKTLWGALKAHSIPDLIGNIKGYAGEKLQKELLKAKINESLAGKVEHADKMSTIKKMIDKASDKIDSGTKKIFNPGSRGAIPSAVKAISDKEFSERIKRVKALADDPQAMMDHMSKSTDGLYAFAPNITSGVNNSMVAAVSFLNSKIPVKNGYYPLARPMEFSEAQKQKFNGYFEAINNPIAQLDNIKNGTLSGDAIEAMSSVHPHLVGEMKMKIMEHLIPEKADSLPYPVKISLAKFLGMPLDQNMDPQNIMSYQASLTGPQKSSQGLPKNSQVIQKANQEVIKRNSTRTQETEADEA